MRNGTNLRKSTAGNVHLVCDLRGKPITGGALAKAASGGTLEAVVERAEFLELLEEHVLKRGLPGSELVKAFTLFSSLGELDLRDDGEIARFRSAVDGAYAEWCKLSAGEKRHILGGWNPLEPAPVTELLRDMAACNNASTWMLTADAHAGKVDFFAENQLVHSTRAVNVAIRPGTSKAQALEDLQAIAKALDDSWEAAIALDGREGLTVSDDGPLAVGTRVIDTGSDHSGGIVIGGFKGANGWIYAYLNNLGEVDFQFGGALKVIPGGVSDIHGADPLAGRRVA